MVTRAHKLMILIACLAPAACVQAPAAPTSSNQDSGLDMLAPEDLGADMGQDSGLDMSALPDMADPPVDMGEEPDFERDMRDSKCEEGAFDACEDPFTEVVCDASGGLVSRTCDIANERCSWDTSGCTSLEFSCLLNRDVTCAERGGVSTTSLPTAQMRAGEVGKFGHSLAYARDLDEIFVGAPDPRFFFAGKNGCTMDDTTAPKVVRYSRGDRRWNHAQTLDGVPGGELGSDIAVSDDGSVLVVAAIKEIDDRFGVVHTYTRGEGGTYSEEAPARLSVGMSEVGFGYRVELSPDGKTLLVSHPDTGNKKGVVNVYREGRATRWCLGATIVADSGSSSAFFGSDLAVDWTNPRKPYVVIGAPDRDNTAGYDGGAFHTALDLEQADCVEPTAVLAAPLPVDVVSSQVGLAVAISPGGKTIAVGVPTLKGSVTQGGAVIFRVESGGVVREQVVYGQLSSAELDGGTAGFGGKLVLPSDGYLIMGGSIANETLPTKTAWSAHALYNESSTLMQKHITEGIGASQGEFHTYTRMLAGGEKELRLLRGQSIEEFDLSEARANDPMCTVATPNLGTFYDELLVTAPDYALFSP